MHISVSLMLEQIFIKQSLFEQCNYLFKSRLEAIATSMLNFLRFFIHEENKFSMLVLPMAKYCSGFSSFHPSL